MDQELKGLVEAARSRTLTKEELAAQRVSFAYGNAPEKDQNTKETVKAVLDYMEVVKHDR